MDYTVISAMTYTEDGAEPLLVVGLSRAADGQINVVKLSTNELYGVTASHLSTKTPNLVAA